MSIIKKKLGLGLGLGFSGVSDKEEIKEIAEVGFDAVFSGWQKGEYIKEIAAEVKKNGLIYQSVHAPFKRINLLWDSCPEGDEVLSELLLCLEDCAESNVAIMVCHVWIGFGDEDHRSEIGIERFRALLDRAEKLGVKVAFENTEGELYLEYLKEKLWDHPAAGFCIDTGHEMCYNYSKDMINKYGRNGKLVATHINDNMAITGTAITWLDDYHLVPFDGVANWQGIADRLNEVGYSDILTAELTVKNKPERTANSIYADLDLRAYLELVYSRLTRFAKLTEQ